MIVRHCLSETLLRRWPLALLVLAVLGFVAYVLVVGGYFTTVLGFAAAYAVFVVGLNFFMGYTGQVSFGQNAFAALGGYASAILTTNYGWEPLAAMAAGAAGAALLALALGYPTLRLRGHYLAMATLAFGLITYELSVQWQGLTQGYMGISGIPPLGIGGFELETDRQQLVALLAAAGLGLVASLRLKSSRFGRALGAISGNEEAARALGIDATRYKLLAFIVAAVLAALSGSLLVHFMGFVSPEMFGLHMVVSGFTMLYVGGIGTVIGPLLGAITVSVLPELFRGFKDYQDLGYGVTLILILIYAPKGLATLARIGRRPPSAPETSAAPKAPVTPAPREAMR